MTILIGVVCDDGIVIGSDSSATFSAGQIPTIEQPMKKVYVVGDDLIFAGTGSGGLGQRFSAILQQVRASPEFLETDCFTVTKHISRATIEDFRFTYGQPGQFGALVAFTCRAAFHLCEFSITDFQPEFKMDEIWFVSMGSGQAIADPFLGLLRRVFFKTSRPRLNEGIWMVTWTLEHAIELNTGGINGPIQIAVLTRKTPDQPFTARLYTENDLEEHRNNVKDAEEHLAAYRAILAGRSEIAPPPPSPPPALS
jgi:20S proteasome alpha/beta subunit